MADPVLKFPGEQAAPVTDARKKPLSGRFNKTRRLILLVITALIVTQSNVGGSLKAALDRFMGSVFGAVSAFASLGMALGPWAGGLVYDTFHGYTWLHAGSFAIGLAAVAVALSFPSKRKPEQPSLDLGRAAA